MSKDISKADEFQSQDAELFSETETAEAVLEFIEDGIKEAMSHLKQPTVVYEKGCKVTVELVIGCNEARTQFSISTSRGGKMAPHKGAKTTLYATGDGESLKVKEFRQIRLPM